MKFLQVIYLIPKLKVVQINYHKEQLSQTGKKVLKLLYKYLKGYDEQISNRKVSNFSQDSYNSDFVNNFKEQNIHNSEIDEQIKTGRIKFFDETKQFGFIVMDEDNSDIFVHQDDLFQGGLNLNHLKQLKTGPIRLQFNVMSYVGKYKSSRKAVGISII